MSQAHVSLGLIVTMTTTAAVQRQPKNARVFGRCGNSHDSLPWYTDGKLFASFRFPCNEDSDSRPTKHTREIDIDRILSKGCDAVRGRLSTELGERAALQL